MVNIPISNVGSLLSFYADNYPQARSCNQQPADKWNFGFSG